MSSKNPLILCVDDEPVNLRLLDALLTPRGYEIVGAENGKEALEKLEEKDFDCVLLDVMMPEMSGFEVCRQMKQDERMRNIPIVMITALRSKEDRIRGIEAGAEDFISKPFDRSEVLARVNMLLRIKHLNDRLDQAYSKITAITSFGRKLISGFDPLQFDFMFDIDQLISQLMKQTGRAVGRPEMIIVGFLDDGETHWYMYESSPDGLKREPADFDLCADYLPEKPGSKILFLNDGCMGGSELSGIAESLSSMGRPVSNVVSFLSRDFCIAALNYEREVTGHDAAVLEGLVAQSLFFRSIAGQVKETENAFDYMVNALARAAEANDMADKLPSQGSDNQCPCARGRGK